MRKKLKILKKNLRKVCCIPIHTRHPTASWVFADGYPAECKNSKVCAPAKHHFDECVERVTNASGEGEAGEDCVEECKGSSHNRAYTLVV